MQQKGRNAQKRGGKWWISVELGVRVMAFENRSGVELFTSNIRDDYTLIEEI